MKKNDIAMIVFVASVSALIAFAIANQIPMLKVDEKGVKVPTAVKIQSDTAEVDAAVFNKESINPTVQTVIGNGAESSIPTTPESNNGSSNSSTNP